MTKRVFAPVTDATRAIYTRLYASLAKEAPERDKSISEWQAVARAGYKGGWLEFICLDDAGKVRLLKRIAKAHGG